MSTTFSCFVDCSIGFSNIQFVEQQGRLLRNCFKWISKRLRTNKRKIIELEGKLSKIAGNGISGGFDNSSMQNAKFDYPLFLKYKQGEGGGKLFISDQHNHIIRSISNISIKKDEKWNGELKIEAGYPENKCLSNVGLNLFRLDFPKGFDWDMNENMYICNTSCICKVDAKSNQVSLVAGHEDDTGYNDGNNDEARFNWLIGVLSYQQRHSQSSSILLYVCDQLNHCIRVIDVTNGKTTTLVGKGKESGDMDGTFHSVRFYCPYDIVKDDENDHILYVSDSYNNKIKMIDVRKEMVSTIKGEKGDTSLFNCPGQMQIIGSFIYIVSLGFKDCIVQMNKYSNQVTKIKFNDGRQVLSYMNGITYHELDQCFYISDDYNIYKLE